MSDQEIQSAYLKLMSFDVASIELEIDLEEAEAKFAALRSAYMAK
jgi:hypothetical protein